MRQRLIEARKAAGLTQEQVAHECGVERATYGTWERGERTPQLYQREKLALALSTTLTEVHGMLSSLPNDSGDLPTPVKLVLALEQAATEIRRHVLCVVNGLLQTGDYAAAIARAVGTVPTSEEYVQRNIDQRAHRQRRVHNGDVELHALTTEHALRSRIGDATVMAGQMEHLLTVGNLSNVTVQVIPFSVGQYEAERIGTFALNTLPFAANPTVDLDAYGGLRLVDDADEVAYFADAFDQASKLALPPKASAAFIDRIRQEWESQT